MRLRVEIKLINDEKPTWFELRDDYDSVNDFTLDCSEAFISFETMTDEIRWFNTYRISHLVVMPVPEEEIERREASKTPEALALKKLLDSLGYLAEVAAIQEAVEAVYSPVTGRTVSFEMGGAAWCFSTGDLDIWITHGYDGYSVREKKRNR